MASLQFLEPAGPIRATIATTTFGPTATPARLRLVRSADQTSST